MISYLVVQVILFYYVSHAADWSYDPSNGPPTWGSTYPLCNGTSQSPIDIRTSDVLPSNISLLPDFGNYEEILATTTIINNGHTAAIILDYGGINKHTIVFRDLPQTTYILEQFHFHWGSDNTRGSEHTIDGVTYPLEIHLVHYSSIYSNVDEAKTHPRGLAVLGVLFEVGTAEDDFINLNDYLDLVQEPNSNSSFEQTAAIHLLPDLQGTAIYRYDGSLTTPTCDESVLWTVFDLTKRISPATLDKFRQLQSEHGPLDMNFRPTQPLNGRTVQVDSQSSASISGQSKTIIYIMIAVVCFYRIY